MQIAYSNISTLFRREMVFRDAPRRVLFELVLPLPNSQYHWPCHSLCTGVGVTLLVFTRHPGLRCHPCCPQVEWKRNICYPKFSTCSLYNSSTFEMNRSTHRDCVCVHMYVCGCTCLCTHSSRGQTKMPGAVLCQPSLYSIEAESLPEPGGRLAPSRPQCSSGSPSRDAGVPGMDNHAQLLTDQWDLSSNHVST